MGHTHRIQNHHEVLLQTTYDVCAPTSNCSASTTGKSEWTCEASCFYTLYCKPPENRCIWGAETKLISVDARAPSANWQEASNPPTDITEAFESSAASISSSPATFSSCSSAASSTIFKCPPTATSTNFKRPTAASFAIVKRSSSTAFTPSQCSKTTD